jgi:hypothetical protein
VAGTGHTTAGTPHTDTNAGVAAPLLRCEASHREAVDVPAPECENPAASGGKRLVVGVELGSGGLAGKLV